MRPARYLVTGGAGFIGSHIATALASQGEPTRIFDNLSTGKRSNLADFADQIEFVEGDLRDLEAVRAAVRGVEVVFHQGALPSVPRSISDPVGSLESNVNGTLHVLVAAREAGVRRVVYASSSSVYGDSPTLPKREEMPPRPLSPYAIQKLTGEQLCLAWTRLYGLEAVALRYFNVFGPRQDPSSEYAAVIPKFLSALLEGRRPTVFGDGEQTRDFTYVDNVVAASLLAATASGASGHALNVGCGEQISLNHLLRTAGELLGVAVRAEYAAARPGDVHDSLADISRARRLLGYSPRIGVREGLMRTLEAMRSNAVSTR